MLFGALALLAVSQLPPATRDTTPAGECLFRRTRSFSWAVDRAGNPETSLDAGFAAIDRALASWAASVTPCSDLVFPPSTRIDDAGTRYSVNGVVQNALIFRQVKCSAVVPNGDPCLTDDSCANKFHCWNHTNAVMVATTDFDPRTGEILHTDLELNVPAFVFTVVDAPACVSPNFNPSCVATDLESVIATGTGLALGLGYVSGPASTMGSSLGPGQLRRSIDSVSSAAICSIYPAAQPPTSCDGGTVRAATADAGVDAGVDGGVVVPHCGADNCAGCCSAAGVCQAGTTEALCGAAGVSCLVCPATSQCLSHACVATPKTGCGCSEGGTVFSAFGLATLLGLRSRRRVSGGPGR